MTKPYQLGRQQQQVQKQAKCLHFFKNISTLLRMLTDPNVCNECLRTCDACMNYSSEWEREDWSAPMISFWPKLRNIYLNVILFLAPNPNHTGDFHMSRLSRVLISWKRETADPRPQLIEHLSDQQKTHNPLVVPAFTRRNVKYLRTLR